MNWLSELDSNQHDKVNSLAACHWLTGDWSGVWDSNPSSSAWKAEALPLDERRKMVPPPGIEPGCPVFQTGAWTTTARAASW